MAKIFALSLLITTAPAICSIGLLVAEYFGLLAWRMSWKSWRSGGKGADGVGLGLLINIIVYICLVAAQFPFVRTARFLTPRIYAGGHLYMLTINFVIVYVCYRVFNGSDYVEEESLVWLLYSAQPSYASFQDQSPSITFLRATSTRSTSNRHSSNTWKKHGKKSCL